MSLDTNAKQGKNSFASGDLLKRDILWDLVNNEDNIKNIFDDELIYRGLIQFSWFHNSQQECMYENKGLSVKKLRKLSESLKNKEYLGV